MKSANQVKAALVEAFNATGTVWVNEIGEELDLRSAADVGAMFDTLYWRGSRAETTADEATLVNAIAAAARASRWGNADPSATIEEHAYERVSDAILDLARMFGFEMSFAGEDMLVGTKQEATDREWDALMDGLPDSFVATFHEMCDAYDRSPGMR